MARPFRRPPGRRWARWGGPVALVLAAGLLPLVVSSPGQAAAEPGALFTRLPGFALAKQGTGARVAPTRYAAYRVDVAGVSRALAHAPARSAVARGATPLTFAVPDPSGRLERFRVQDDPVMEPGLQARHPGIRTYAGRGLDDPTRTIRLDVTPMGFHASVRSPGGGHAWYVDPAYNQRGTTTHLSYYGSSVAQRDGVFVERNLADTTRALASAPTAAANSPVVQRTYRLAFVTDPSYAAYFGSANVAAEKATLVNRVDQVYNDDLAIKLELIAENDKLNLATAAKATGANGPCGAHGCYTADELSTCGPATLSRNEFVLGQIVGADSYDLGHLGLGVDGGGIAGVGVVGGRRKADGCTGLTTPRGDVYAIDYVAHELGHQFGGDHTFNGTQGNCAGTTRTAATSVEPGSGSSVMAYAGICGQDDLQSHSDPYFSQRSIDEVTATVTAVPATVNEQQVVSLRGFDTPGESFQLTYLGQSRTLTKGSTYTASGITAAVQQLTGFTPGIDGYDGDTGLDNGFTLSFGSGSGAAGQDVGRFGVAGASSGVSGSVGTIYDGGTTHNRGSAATTANHPPSVTAPADRTIPVRTPFTLTGSGSDPDGDALSYLWEENDPGGPNGTRLVSNTKTNGPLFRVFGTAAQVSDADSLLSPSPGENTADGNPTRTFPDLAQILAGNTNAATGGCPAAPSSGAVPRATVDCYSEFLPTSDYTAGPLDFRLTARDGETAGGGTAYDDVRLTLDTTAGPFRVTSRATSASPAVAGTPETVTWAVNGTDVTGLAPQVTITLSTDGGHAYPYVLAQSTPNDGSQSVTLPGVSTDRARIKVEASDNYFFDVNDADFTISSSLSLTDPGDQAVQYSDSFDPGVTVDATSQAVDGDQLVATVSGVPGLTVTRQAATPDGQRPGVATFVLDGAVTADPGAHTATLQVSEPGPRGDTASEAIKVTVGREDAAVAYTGDTSEKTIDGTTAVVTLSADVAEETAGDSEPGDLSTATVTFVDRATGRLLCSAAVVPGSVPRTGGASCDAQLGRTGDATTYTVGSVVGGNYRRNDSADDAQVTVHKDYADTTPPRTVFTGGPGSGSFVLTRSATWSYGSTEDGSTFVCALDGSRVDCGAVSVTLRRLRSGTHVLRVAARDSNGNLDPTPARRVFAVPFDDTQLGVLAGSWTRLRDATAYRGTYLRTSSRGGVLVRRGTRVDKIALVVGTGPGYGKVAVFFRGTRIGTISLASSARHTRVLVPVRTFSTPRSGQVRIRTLSGRTVRIEGLGIFSRP